MLKQADYQNLKLAIPEIKKQTISDKFQEALGATSLTAEGTFIPRPGAFRFITRLELSYHVNYKC